MNDTNIDDNNNNINDINDKIINNKQKQFKRELI